MEFQDNKTLIFKVGKEEFGIHINQVISIERMQGITPIPNPPAHVIGVTTIRDVVTPVVDLRAALTGKTLAGNDVLRIVIVKVEEQAIGLIVDATTDVLQIQQDSIQHPNLLETSDGHYLKGVSNLNERLIFLLDIEKLLEDTTNLDELKNLKDAITA